MRIIAKSIVSVVALFVLAAPVGLVSFFTHADGGSGSWLAAEPSLTKIVDLPTSHTPSRGDIDCTPDNYTTSTHDSITGCVVSTFNGFIDTSGTAILSTSSSLTAMTIRPYGNYTYNLMPIPNQSAVLSASSAPVMGSYLHLYDHLPLTPSTDTYNNPLYTVTVPPQVDVKDWRGKLFPANLSTRSFSSNGAWMVIEDMQNAMLRINLATLDVTPFALSLAKSSSDYSTHYARTTISDDGRYVAVFSYEYRYFRIYDLSTCSATWVPSSTNPPDCQYRDMWPVVSSQLPGFRSVYSVRFSNDDNINFDASYNFKSNSDYSVARFNLTAAGGLQHKIDYLALGDSYISGQGTFVYKDGTDTATNTCHLSELSYPFIIGADLADSYNSVACSGAQTKDITGAGFANYNNDPKGAQSEGMASPGFDKDIYANFLPGYRVQDSFISTYQPRIVTLSIGGNDMGFADIVQACATPHLSENTCFNNYADRRSIAQGIASLYSTLQQTYTDILNADPGVQLYVIGYPQIAVQGDCADNVHLNSAEIAFSQQLIADLDDVIGRAATSAGARYVDMQNALAGHRLCEAKSIQVGINGLTAGNDAGPFGLKIIGSESFHPNVLGQQLLAQAVLKQTDNFHEAMPAANQSVAAPTINDPLAQALMQGYQPGPGETGTISASYNDSLLPDVMMRGTSGILSIDSSENSIMPSQTFTAVLHSSPVTLGTFTADSDGNLSGQIIIPADTAPGFHTLHLYGRNIAGEQVDYFEIIYVAASSDDYDGDGITNSSEQCLVMPPSGHDADQDGIDDACDPTIGDPPIVTHGYPTIAKLTGNSVSTQ